MSNNYFNTGGSYTIQNSGMNYSAPNSGSTITIQGQYGTAGSANQYYYPYTQSAQTHYYPQQPQYVGSWPQYGGVGGYYQNSSVYDGYSSIYDLELIALLSDFMSEIFKNREKVNYKKLDYTLIQHIKNQTGFGASLQHVIYRMRMAISHSFPFLFEYFENFEKNEMEGYLAIL